MATHHDIANAILKSQERRESSYVKSGKPFGVGEYTKTWGQVCEEACAGTPEILELVQLCCFAGYCETWEWAEEHKTKS
jgi:hypothetical protein